MFHPFIICHNVFMNHPPLLVKYDVFLLNLFLTLRGIHLYLSLSLSLAHSMACVFKAREQSATGANKRMYKDKSARVEEVEFEKTRQTDNNAGGSPVA